MKDSCNKNVSKLQEKIITICMDVFGINHRIDVNFDFYYDLLPTAYEIVKNNGVEKAQLIYNKMLGELSAQAADNFESDLMDWPEEDSAIFKGNSFIATLLGSLLGVAPAYVKADWDFESAVAQIDCPCCGERLSAKGGD